MFSRFCLSGQKKGESTGVNMFHKPRTYQDTHSGYKSEFGQFIGKFLQEHPEVVRDQHKGWYIFWDHKVDFDELKKMQEDNVPVKGYDYF
jgi:hypothetical protein